MVDVVTRQIRNMSVKFLGEDAAKNAAIFDYMMVNSPEFRSKMTQTEIQFGRINDPPKTSIYIGSTIGDLKSVPDFDESKFAGRLDRDHPGYGNFINQNTWGIVLGNPATISLDGNTYKSSLQLQMAHELLHPLQRIKDLAEVGPVFRPSSEKAVQDQEQDIAKQLGYRIGIDFPDVQAADHGYEVVPSRSLNPPPTFAPPTPPPLPPTSPLPPPTFVPPRPPPPPTFGPPPLLPLRGLGLSVPPAPPGFPSWPDFGPPQNPTNVAFSNLDKSLPQAGPNFDPGGSRGAGLPGSLFQSYSQGGGYDPSNPSTYVPLGAPLQAPLGPLNAKSDPETGEENFDRVLRPRSPYKMNGLPDSGSPDLSDPPGRAPQQAYGSPQSGWSVVPTNPASPLTPPAISPVSISPSVSPAENAHSSAAFAAPDFDARPLPGNGILSGLSAITGRGNGILSGLTPADAWPSPRDGILGGLTPPSAGDSGSGSSEGDDHPSWAQMLQDMWLRRMQDDPSPDDSNR
jgi:hypothetical protein